MTIIKKPTTRNRSWRGNWRTPEVKEYKFTKWFWLVQHAKNLKLGKYTDIGEFTYINAQNGVIIEEGVEIGSHCAIYSVSSIDGKCGAVVLKKNCKIGSHSTVMPGVTVGENSVIGAHSLVKENIPDNVMAFGCPAKIRKKIS